MTEFKFPLAFTRKRKKIDRFDSLPQFHWEEITCQDVIGQGTYGAVFISRYRPQDKPAETVVVKKLLSTAQEFKETFVKEATILNDLKHKNIVSFKAACKEPVAMMLEYVYFDFKVFGGDGKVSSLNNFLSYLDQNDCQGIGASFMEKIARDVITGLKYLHDNEIAHRDLKPANVLVSNHHYRGEKDTDKLANAWNMEPVICQLTDFGESRSKLIQTKTMCQTKTGNIDRGTVPFMAPEILTDNIFATASLEDFKKADIWAYGMLLFLVINPCLHYPYEIDLKQGGGGGNAKENIQSLLKQRRKPEGSLKYRERCQTEWLTVWNAQEACTHFSSSKRPDASGVLKILSKEMESHGDLTQNLAKG